MVTHSGDLYGIQRVGNFHLAFAIVRGIDYNVEFVGKAPFKLERLRIAAVVLDCHGVGEL